MSTDNLSLVNSALTCLAKAVNGGGSTPLLDMLSEDVVVEHDAPNEEIFGGKLHGRQCVMDFITLTIPNLVEDVALERPLEVFVSDSRVIVLGSLRYGITSNDLVVSNKEFALVVDLRERLIVRVMILKDLTELTEAHLPRGWSRTASIPISGPFFDMN